MYGRRRRREEIPQGTPQGCGGGSVILGEMCAVCSPCINIVVHRQLALDGPANIFRSYQDRLSVIEYGGSPVKVALSQKYQLMSS